ncbi:unnamed protein product [Paramecium sonneborni]|uniref:Uncharacterized protein n=1 Tax=Paramecium sonneborni TaxID=65129 RepID=A0A8S1PA51_9CILI|nr:unnamed protein product [Paramecium sonneborni]
MFKQNPILNLFSNDCDMSQFFLKNRQLNNIRRLDMLIRDEKRQDNKLKRMIIDCGNKCGIRNSRVSKNEISFMQIKHCSIFCKKRACSEQKEMNQRTKNNSVQPQRMEIQYDFGGWTNESWKSV